MSRDRLEHQVRGRFGDAAQDMGLTHFPLQWRTALRTDRWSRSTAGVSLPPQTLVLANDTCSIPSDIVPSLKCMG